MKFAKRQDGIRIRYRPSLEISDLSFDERNAALKQKIPRGRHLPLAEIPVPEEYYALKKKKLYTDCFEILEAIKEKYGYQVTSYRALKEYVKPIGVSVPGFSLRLCSLWAHGYLRKYAKSYYERGLSNPGKAGKYYGVHYQVIEK